MPAKQIAVFTALSLVFSLPVAAFAENNNVNVYGVANISFELVSNGTTSASVSGARTVRKISSNASRLGLKGSEDLSDDLSALWQLESLIAMDNAGGTFATRNTYAGLSSKRLGKLLLGRYDTPYSTIARRLDVFADTIADSHPLMGGTTGVSASLAFASRPGDSILYISPELHGFSGSAQYVNRAESNISSTQPKSSLLSLAGWYIEGPIYAAIAQEAHQIDSLTGNKENAWKLALGYTPERFVLNFVYEKSSDNLAPQGANQWGHHAYYLSGKYLVDSNTFKAAYSNIGQLGTTADTGAQQYTLGYDHNLSSRTTLYGLYTLLHNQSAINYGLSSASSGGGDSTIVQPGSGASPSAWSFGLKHVF